MSMSLDAAYRLITVRLSTANDPIQPIRLAGGDIAGRVLRVEYPAEGLGELGQNEARLAYNPNPDGDASGGTRFSDCRETSSKPLTRCSRSSWWMTIR